MLKSVTLIFFSAFVLDITSARQRRTSTEEPETWTGRWFPEKPVTLAPPKHDSVAGRRQMGVANSKCDDAKTNLTLDWDNSVLDYTCMDPRNRIVPDLSIVPIIEYENIPLGYQAAHFCMYEPLSYDRDIPTFGPHRPLWGRWGTYKFIPKQRWLHNLEHGGVVALYHPCADIRGISKFKELVKNCLRRHVISPSQDISPDRPFVLVAWGVKLRMSVVSPARIHEFIKEYALKGPEKIASDGQYDVLLQEPAEIVSDYEDSSLCSKPTQDN